MAATAHIELSVVELKAEIERLGRELDQASSEKIQSAQLGLVLLEEKSTLQQRCDELESLYENTKHELDITQEALMKLDTTQKVTTRSGIEQENALLNESAAMESSLTLQILELESESKQLRHELDRVVSERDRLLAESSELGADKASRESERAALRAELRETRQREQRLLVDIGDLEDENISLQKQVSALRSSQVEFEGLKHEVRQLREEAENARAAAEETAALRRIAERQLAEALEALQAEREAKFAAKKELDAHLSREAAYNITNLAYSIRGMPDDGTEDEGEPGGSSSAELATAMGDHHADLFSEVHLHEISRLEKQLEQAHNENSQLSASMRSAQASAESESAAATLLRTGLTRALSRVNALHSLHGDCAPLEDEKSESGVSARASKWLTWWRVSGGELGSLAAQLTEMQGGAGTADTPAAIQRQALVELSDRVAEAEVRAKELHAEAEFLRTLAAGAGRALSAAAPVLLSAAETLAQIYHHVCAVNGTQPERLLLEHAGQTDVGVVGGAAAEAVAMALAAGELEGLRGAAQVARSADTVLDQLTHLRAALDTALDSRLRHQPGKELYYFEGLLYCPVKKIKEHTNAKLKLSDNKYKVYEKDNGDINLSSVASKSICSGKTVKEITTYFENISKTNNNIQQVKYEKKPKFDYWKLNINTKRNNMKLDFNKPITYTTNLQIFYLSRYTNTPRHMERRNVGWNKVYIKKMSRVNDNQNTYVIPSIRQVLKSGLTTCVGLLQHLM